MESRNQVLRGQLDVVCPHCGEVLVTNRPGDFLMCGCHRTIVQRFENRVERKENGCSGCGT